MQDTGDEFDLLLKQLEKLQARGFDMSFELHLYNTGGECDAFRGVYYEHVRHPGLLKQSDIDYLAPIFGERLSELEPKDPA